MQTINIPIDGRSSVSYQYDLEMAVNNAHYVYGYGYGFFQSAAGPPYYTNGYFDIFSVEGDLTGYGVGMSQLVGSTGIALMPFGVFSMGYGWGYEETPFLLGNSLDVLRISARVFQNGVAPINPSNIPIVFTAGPGVILSSNVVYTNSSGIAYVYARIDSTVTRNVDENGEHPNYQPFPNMGFAVVEASVALANKEEDWKYEILMSASQSFGDEYTEAISIPVIGSFVLGT
jgi:hypothetical protein